MPIGMFRNVMSIGAGGGEPTEPPIPLTWEPLERGLGTGTTTLNFTTVVYCGEQTYIASGGTGYTSRTDDEGSFWYPLERSVGAAPSLSVLDMIWVDTGGAGIVLALLNFGRVTISLDKGTTWEELTDDGFGMPRDPSSFAHIGGGVIMLTANGGTLTDSVGLVQDCGRGSVSFDRYSTTDNFSATSISESSGVIYVTGSDKGGSISTDGWQTFTEWTAKTDPSLPTTNLRRSTASGGKATFCGDTGIAYYTTNGGVNYQQVLPPGLGSGVTDTVYATETDGFNWLYSQGTGYYAVTSDFINLTQLPRGLNAGAIQASAQDFATDGKGTWIAVCSSGYAAKGTP